jgi:hypothetical protein
MVFGEKHCYQKKPPNKACSGRWGLLAGLVWSLRVNAQSLFGRFNNLALKRKGNFYDRQN